MLRKEKTNANLARDALDKGADLGNSVLDKGLRALGRFDGMVPRTHHALAEVLGAAKTVLSSAAERLDSSESAGPGFLDERADSLGVVLYAVGVALHEVFVITIALDPGILDAQAGG